MGACPLIFAQKPSISIRQNGHYQPLFGIIGIKALDLSPKEKLDDDRNWLYQ